MAAGSPTKYTAEDKARVFVVLTSNDGNIKRTMRDTGVPMPTIRRWRDDWERNGPPDTSEVGKAVDDFYEEAATVRLEALREVRNKIPKATPSALIAIVGVLDDKIARVKGIGTSRQVEHKLTLPSAKEVQELIGGFLQAGEEAARRRDEEIVDAEVIEQPPRGLLPGHH